MGGKIDTHQVTLLVQTFDVTPTHIVLRHGWQGDLHTLAKHAEERVLHLCLFLLVRLSIAHKGIEEHLPLGICGKVVLTTDAEAVEAATQRQTFISLAVD